MFKTLFSKMLSTYLAVILSLLLLLGITVTSASVRQYKSEREQELFREGTKIHDSVITKYIDEEKRSASLEELSSIARKFDGMIQLRFIDEEFGKVSVTASSANEKWMNLTDFYMDIEKQADEIANNTDGIIISDGFSKLSDMPTITLVRNAVRNNNTIGTIFFTVDISNTYESINNMVIDVILFSMLAIVLAILAVLYITERMTRPIIQMTKTVRQFSKGNYDARITYKGDDEVGELAFSFNKMADEVNTLEAARRSFVANVSHELRSPLTSMRGFLVAMQDGTISPEDYQKYLSIVIDENNRMISMVNDLLDMARIESGEHTLNFSVFDITETIRCTIITFEARILEKKLEVSIELGNEQVFVEADKYQIIQILRNLIDNAIKFSPKGGKLSLTVLEQRSVVWVCVKDSGTGIKDEDIPHVFDRFYKAEKAHTPNSNSGTGLGLAIAKRIIDAHGQSITVKNEGGACFMFSLKRVARNRPFMRRIFEPEND
ncbi:MAG: cell wall metabolism sensor histidine kinase WalK [Clostridiales bacterium]|nr:cell wall metabolism sensor histidine kinase WalK [Clostridiales bacterium]